MNTNNIEYFYYSDSLTAHLPKDSDLFGIGVYTKISGHECHHYVRVAGDENIDLWTLVSKPVVFDYSENITLYDDYDIILQSKNPYFLLQSLLYKFKNSSSYSGIDELAYHPIIVAYEMSRAVELGSYINMKNRNSRKFKALVAFFRTDDPDEIEYLATTVVSWYGKASREDFNNFNIIT